MGDLISRQAAVDAIERTDWYHQNQKGEMKHGANSKEHQAWYKAEDVYKALEGVPSAEPEPLTDKEKRIFLAAMAREKKVCRRVHAEWSEGDLDCGINLVQVCHEIERKVKGALWGT